MKKSIYSSKTEYTAIVTDVHYRMSLAVIRDLAEAGVTVIGVEKNHLEPPLGFYSKYVSESVLMDESSYLDELYELCRVNYGRSGKKPVILSVGTATMDLFSDDVRRRFSEVAGFCLPSPEQLLLLNDKRRLAQLAVSCGVPVPSEYDAPYGNAVYPCIVKPLCGEKFGMKAGDRYRIVYDGAQLADAVLYYKEHCGGETPVVQQFVSGPGFGCEVFAENGRVLTSLCHERLREYPAAGGPSSCCRAVCVPEISAYTEQICKELGLSGLAMFEYKRDKDGKYFLLECNPRVWGSYPLTRAAKSNMTLCWFKTAFEAANPNDVFEIRGNDYRNVRMHFPLSDIFAGAEYIKRGQIGKGLAGIFSWMDPFIKNGLLELKDMKPAMVYLKNRL